MLKNAMRLAFNISIYTIFFSLFFAFTQNFAVHGAETIRLELHTAGGVIIYENRPVILNINGQILAESEDMPSIILGGRTFVPLRHFFESDLIGAVIDFQEEHQRILIAYGSSIIVMHIGDYYFNFNIDTHRMDVAPQLINGRTMVPASFVAGVMGFDVRWDEDTYTVYFTSDTESEQISDTGPFIDDENGFYYGHYHDDELNIDVAYEDAAEDLAEMSLDVSSGPIAAESNLETEANSILWNTEHNRFVISAASRITDVDWRMLPDGRLIIDIYNARMAFPQTTYSIHNDFITTIRTGLNNFGGVNVTRVVFDLKAPVVYNISISEDRHHIFVNFENNLITNVRYINEYVSLGRESIVLTGVIAPTVNVFPLFNPSRLVIDLPGAVAGFEGIGIEGGRLAGDIWYSQFDENTVRVVVGLNQAVSFNVERKGNTTTVHLTDPTYRNIRFDSEAGVFVITKPTPDFAASQLVRHEEYLNLRYSFTLHNDFSDFFGYGRYMVRESGITDIEIITNDGITSFIINTNRIMAYIVTEDTEHIFIRPVSPREVYSFIVLIDPGHGGSDPGAVHHGMTEAYLNLDVSLMVIDMLRADGIVRVFTTRYDDSTVLNSHRANMANQVADIFVSVHHNAANGRAHGTETLYTIHANENQTGFNSRSMAQIFQSNLVEDLDTVDRGLRHRPLIQILNSTTIPAVLLEIEFMDVPERAAVLADPAFRRRTAESIVRSIYEVMEAYSPSR